LAERFDRAWAAVGAHRDRAAELSWHGALPAWFNGAACTAVTADRVAVIAVLASVYQSIPAVVDVGKACHVTTGPTGRNETQGTASPTAAGNLQHAAHDRTTETTICRVATGPTGRNETQGTASPTAAGNLQHAAAADCTSDTPLDGKTARSRTRDGNPSI